MTDEAVAAPAAPEPVSAPANEHVQPPRPIESEGPQRDEPVKAEKPEAKEEAKKYSATPNEAIKRAEAKVKEELAKKEAAAKVETKEPVKTEAKAEPKVEAKTEPKVEKTDAPTRDETGKFVARDPEKAEAKADTTFREPPSRFKSDQAATAEWEKTPEPVKAAIHRATRELEAGIEKYRQEVEPIKPFMDLAKQNNTSIARAMENYINLERTILNSPEQGLQMVADYAGIDLRQYAAKLMGQEAPQASQMEAENRQLRNAVRDMQSRLADFEKTDQERSLRESEATVGQFAQQHPRFDELTDAIALEIKLLKQAAPDMPANQLLEQAYKRAELLNPAAPLFTAPAQTRSEPIHAAEAQTLIKGSKSISGAPSSGSDPVSRRAPSPSIRDALRRAASV